jgi:SRSO17 transposase
MEAKDIRVLQAMLNQYLQTYADCIDRRDTRAHLTTYVRGQLSELPRKSVEPIALAAGTPVRTLQEFLSQHRWQEDRVRNRLQRKVAREHGDRQTIGIIDETSAVKKGDKTPGVQRQYCGTIGKQDNCIVTVHLGYAAGDFHCLLDGELFLPEAWSADRARCAEAGIPEDMIYRPKTEIALELYERARENGVRFAWLTFDEWYGGKPAFLQGLWRQKQSFAGEVPRCSRGWIDLPRVTTRPYRHRRGRPRKTPRLVTGSLPSQTVEELWREHPRLQRQRWQQWRVKDSDKGPVLWETQHTTFYPQDPEGLPGPPHLLVIARNVLDPREVKFFLGFSPRRRPRVAEVLHVGFNRWRVERCFEDSKGAIGLAHYEGRCYRGLKRHLILSAVSLLFLAESRERLRGKKPGVDGLPGAYGRQRLGPILVA